MAAAMLWVITVLVWLPPLVTQLHDTGAWSPFLMSSIIAAGASMVADSYRGTGWATLGPVGRAPARGAPPRDQMRM